MGLRKGGAGMDLRRGRSGDRGIRANEGRGLRAMEVGLKKGGWVG